MAVELATLDLALDIMLKLFLITAFIYLLVILHNVDKTVRSVQESAESVERTSKKLGKLFAVARYVPFVGRRRKNG